MAADGDRDFERKAVTVRQTDTGPAFEGSLEAGLDRDGNRGVALDGVLYVEAANLQVPVVPRKKKWVRTVFRVHLSTY